MSEPETNVAPQRDRTWESIYKDFLAQLPKVSQSYDPRTLFADAKTILHERSLG